MMAVPFQQNGLDKYLLISEIPGDACPACRASIGGAIFVQTDNAWEIDVEQRHITTLGVLGRAPEGTFTQIGADQYGVLFNDSYVENNRSGERIVLISEAENSLRVVLAVETAVTHFEEGGDGDIAWAYESDLSFIEGDNPEYDDVQITTHGSRPIEGVITKFEKVKTYTFGRRDYYLLEQETRVSP